MARYPSIGDHGLIGDQQTAALVTTSSMTPPGLSGGEPQRPGQEEP